ncbi:Ubiquinone biosynthesis O-methyltransferase [subsurface metagenome]
MQSGTNMSSEYAERGEYHRHLDPNWSYYPTYLAKMKFIKDYLQKIPKKSKVLDLGCGEGVLVEEFRNLGYDIIGLDQNYSSEFVLRGDIRKTPFPDKNLDVILCLDVIEHLNYKDQEKAISEIKRVLKDNGAIVLTIPNLAHFYARLNFLLKGQLDRTASVKKHPGDRPIKEYLQLLKREGFEVVHRKGLFPTFPLIYQVIQRWPSRSLWLYSFINLLFPYANLCFLNIIIAKKASQHHLQKQKAEYSTSSDRGQ